MKIQPLIQKLGKHRKFALELLICFAAGTLYAAALPPFNLEFLAYVTLVPLLRIIYRKKPLAAAFCGWIWGFGWSFFAYRFLREINPVIPYLLPPVLSLWPAVWAAAASYMLQKTLTDEKNRFLTGTLAVFGCAALFTLVEWTRSRLFVWNDLGVTQWRNIPLIQIASVTGSYGVNYLVALGNLAIFICFFKKRRTAAIAPILLIISVMIWGNHRSETISKQIHKGSVWKPVLIQGDLSQRRHATRMQAEEALEIYGSLSMKALQQYPESRFIIWPESAIPLSYYTEIDMREFIMRNPNVLNNLRYQQLVRLLTVNFKCRMLIGALDYASVKSDPYAEPVASNSALFFDENGKVLRKYSKIHRVPFGEYIPFRKFIPKFITDYIDMGRDIVSGTDHEPLQLAPGVSAGVAICYEGVFGYITRESAKRGANLLIVLSNDAWYPRSSEPEQHLANAVMRSVETGLDMIRSGNNGGSGVVTRTGVFTQCYSEGSSRPELWRGRTIRQVKVNISPEVRRTVYVRYGEFFILILMLIVSAWTATIYFLRKGLNK